VIRRLYRRLAKGFPHEFKMAYGSDVEQLGEDVIEKIGFWGRVSMMADLALRVPIEYISEIKQDLIYALRGSTKPRESQ